ncbi:MAG TPA: protein-L-isoaspartate(D-aspartate) O-methyltransferase [Rhodospirillales bacterium]|jgi:protein-L-isoaspartate(D-aspartate) O-methyltransferase|nr:protein-L-isoaspartate(D-aspartate) O-methyltransferase [Rhodospirillales bacterium]HIL76394.1 protein-L-isoaspartate(D-aspartate) O-methyltransferase [Rhodospirillales bacterium]
MSFDSNHSENIKMELVFSLRRAGVTEPSVVATMERVPRELFVPEVFRSRSYEDITLPIGHHQTLSQPAIVGLMTEALELNDRKKVLEVGTGSGYQTSILALICRRVYTIERHASLLQEAEKRFDKLRIRNVTAKVGDGTLGWEAQAPFERIIVTAAAADIPPILADQLSIGGIMIVPIGLGDNFQTILKVIKKENGFKTKELRDVRFVPLIPEEVTGT